MTTGGPTFTGIGPSADEALTGAGEVGGGGGFDSWPDADFGGGGGFAVDGADFAEAIIAASGAVDHCRESRLGTGELVPVNGVRVCWPRDCAEVDSAVTIEGSGGAMTGGDSTGGGMARGGAGMRGAGGGAAGFARPPGTAGGCLGGRAGAVGDGSGLRTRSNSRSALCQRSDWPGSGAMWKTDRPALGFGVTWNARRWGAELDSDSSCARNFTTRIVASSSGKTDRGASPWSWFSGSRKNWI